MTYRFKRPRPRDEWGRIKSQQQIEQEQAQAKLESLQLMQQELLWMAQEADEED